MPIYSPRVPVGAYINRGVIDASGNPNYPAAQNGDTYTVSVAGKIGGASGTTVEVGDQVVANADNAGGTQAAVGASWNIIQHNLVNPLLAANNLSDVGSASTSRTNLGLGNVDNTSDANKPVSTAQATAIALAKIQSLVIACSDETTALTAGTGKVTFRMPYAFTLTAVRASLTTAQPSGAIFTVDINEGGVTILSTKLTIDNTEKTSTTAATLPVISDASLADDAEITVDIDQVGDAGAAGLKITLIGTRT